MPGPAARVGDMSAHGGAILPPGVPTVLIGGMPAATVTSMHVCPLVTVLVPHVGGPILPPGVPTVLIGGMPAATVGDMITCTGPPDVIIPPGCPTVLIGTSGGGSGSGGGGAAGSATAGAHAALIGEPGEEVEGPHWIEFRFVDSAGNPVSGVPYVFTGIDGKDEKGILTGDGTLKRGGLPDSGNCTVSLFTVYDAKWSKESARVGDEVKLSAHTIGFEDGTPAQIRIWERDIDGADDFMAEIETTVQGDRVEAEWKYEYHEDRDEARVEDKKKGYSAPEYYFVVHVKECKTRSGLLVFQDWIEITLKDSDENPYKDEDYILYLRNGEMREGTLDANGYAKEEGIPPGICKVRFPNLEDEIHPSLSIVVYDDTGMTPLANVDFSIKGPDGSQYSGTTDEAGYLFREDVEIDDYDLTVGDITVKVPVVLSPYQRHLQRIPGYVLS